MITVLTGENSFEVQRALAALQADFAGEPELIDGSELELRQLPDLLMGGTLFARERLVIIKRLADNKTIWPVFDEWLERVSEDVRLVLVEPTLDKRTKVYKLLKAAADMREFPAWKEGDTATAQRWLAQEVTARGLAFDQAVQRTIVGQVGADPWQLHYALEKLAVLDTVTPEVVREVIEPLPHDNVFVLLDTALKGDRATVHGMVTTLEHSDEAYRVFGLLASQVTQLAAVAIADRPGAEVASAFGIPPFALSRLQGPAGRLGRRGVRRLVKLFAQADHRMKTGAEDPWVIIETTLMLCASDSTS